MLPPRVAWQRLLICSMSSGPSLRLPTPWWQMSLLANFELTVELLTDGHESRTRVCPSNIIHFAHGGPVATLFG